MQINEIFSSIDGEGIRTGYLVTFIRSQHCTLKCTYCDTLYSLEPLDSNGNKQYTDMTVEEIVAKCKELGNNRITFTGGEPLMQKDAKELLSKLTLAGFEVNVETNGNIPIRDYRTIDLDLPIAQNRLIMTMDWKSPSSGMRDKMVVDNLYCLSNSDVLKFVVGSKEDLDDMKNTLEQYKIRCNNIFVSPIFGQIEPKDIVEYLKENNMQNVRMQLQLHKFIWPVEMRGV